MWIPRLLEDKLRTLHSMRPAVLLTGARQTGKSTLLQSLFSEATYVTLDRIDVATSAEENPEKFLSTSIAKGHCILDEVQYAPSLFRELKIQIDAHRQQYGLWSLTGSQRFELMEQAVESLAGRISILHLETLSAQELRNSGFFAPEEVTQCLWKGGYPEMWVTPQLTADVFFSNYVQTYLERDLRGLLSIELLRDFQRFMKLCALQAGQLLNYSNLAKDVGVSPTKIRSWVSILEASGIIYLLPPFFGNIGKRLVKSPKLYFADTGLLTFLLNIQSLEVLQESPLKGRTWENFVFTEYLKNHLLTPGRDFFFYRDQNGVEIDFLVERNHTLFMIEAKASERVDPKKLHFKNVTKHLTQYQTVPIVCCQLPAPYQLFMKDYQLMNPLHQPTSLDVATRLSGDDRMTL